MHAQDLVHDGVEVVQPGPVRELLPGRVKVRELLLELVAQARLHLGLARELDEGPLYARAPGGRGGKGGVSMVGRKWIRTGMGTDREAD